MNASVDLQRTEQWHQDRSGRLTASRFKDVIAWGDRDRHGKRKPLAARTLNLHMYKSDVLVLSHLDVRPCLSSFIILYFYIFYLEKLSLLQQSHQFLLLKPIFYI